MLTSYQTPWYGPTVIKKNNYPYNATLFTKLTGLSLSALYDCQDVSGVLVDKINARNLTAVNTPIYRNLNDGKYGIRCDSAVDGFKANVNNPALASTIYGAICSFNTTAAVGAVNPIVMGVTSDTAFPYVIIYRADDNVKYFNCLVRDSVDKSLFFEGSSAPNSIEPKRPILVMLQIDRTANLARVLYADANRLLFSSSGSIVGFATFDGGTNPTFNIGGGGSTVGSNVNLVFVASGAQCEGTTKLLDTAYRLGFIK